MTLEVGEGVSVTHRPLFTPGERPSTHCTRGWVGPRAGMDRYGKSRPHQDSIPGPSSPKPVAIPPTLPGPKLYLTVLYIYIYIYTHTHTHTHTHTVKPA